jgi:hypothetical protein
MDMCDGLHVRLMPDERKFTPTGAQVDRRFDGAAQQSPLCVTNPGASG